jgi:hypothetical protein
MTNLTIADVEQMTDAYIDVLNSVPKGNSEFQTAVLGTLHVQDQRTRRAIIMEINSLEGALHLNNQKQTECLADIRIAKRNIERIKREIDSMKKTKAHPDDIADKEDEIIKIEAKINLDTYEMRKVSALAKDAIIKLDGLIKLLNSHKDYTREEFEAKEPEYYMQRLIQEAVQQFAFEGRINPGTIDSLMRIPLKDPKTNEVRSLKIGEILGMVVAEMRGHFVLSRLPAHVEKLLNPNELQQPSGEKVE